MLRMIRHLSDRLPWVVGFVVLLTMLIMGWVGAFVIQAQDDFPADLETPAITPFGNDNPPSCTPYSGANGSLPAPRMTIASGFLAARVAQAQTPASGAQPMTARPTRPASRPDPSPLRRPGPADRRRNARGRSRVGTRPRCRRAGPGPPP